MNFQESLTTCFSKYADFTGRAIRSEYWYFALFITVINAGLSRVSPMIGLVFVLATFVPSLAAGVRRLHDTDRSGWWLLVGLIPLIGWIWIIYLLALPGTSQETIAQ